MMYDDIPFNYRDIAVHDSENVKGFFGEYRWLSNFYPCKTEFDGRLYKCSEAAYMAAKLEHPEDRVRFEQYDGRTAKLEGRKVKLRPKWEYIKLGVMSQVLRSKFELNDNLLKKLLETGDKYLEETNWWKDTFWGVDYKLGGKNMLGQLLMDIRHYLRRYE